MMKIWVGVFWSPADGARRRSPAHAVGRLGGPPLMVVPTAVLVLGASCIAVAAGPLYDFVERAAADLLDPTAYIQAVLGS